VVPEEGDNIELLQLHLKHTSTTEASWSLVTTVVELTWNFVLSTWLRPFTCPSTSWPVPQADLGLPESFVKNARKSQNCKGLSQTCIVRTKFSSQLKKTLLHQLRILQGVKFLYYLFPAAVFDNGLIIYILQRLGSI